MVGQNGCPQCGARAVWVLNIDQELTSVYCEADCGWDCSPTDYAYVLERQRTAAAEVLKACKWMLEDMETYGMDADGYHDSMNAGREAIAKAAPEEEA